MPSVVVAAAHSAARPVARAALRRGAANAARVLPTGLAPWAPAAACARRIGEDAARRAAGASTSRAPAAPAAAAADRAGAAPAGAAAPARPRRAPRGRRPLRARAALVFALAHAGLAAAKAAAALGLKAAGALGGAGATAAAAAAAAAAVAGRFAARRVRRDGAARAGGRGGMAVDVSVVTFNVRGVMDRWPERAPLLRSCLRALDADVVCFQEVLTGEYGQDRDLVGPAYSIYECRAALDSVAAASAAGAAFGTLTRALLGLSLCRGWMLAAPGAVEGWREAGDYSGSASRSLRDAAIAPFFGNSIAARLPPAAASSSSVSAGGGRAAAGGEKSAWGKAAAGGGEVLLLGSFRAAQRMCFELGGGGGAAAAAANGGGGGGAAPQRQEAYRSEAARGGGNGGGHENGGGGGSGGAAMQLWVVNTHLCHATPETRERQAREILSWMDAVRSQPGCAGVVITGDLNAPPGEPTHAAFRERGYRSACMVANGREPPVTWPSGLVAPLMDRGEPHCADYVYVWAAPGYDVRVTSAGVTGDAPAPGDATLYPSDHYGVGVKLAVARL